MKNLKIVALSALTFGIFFSCEKEETIADRQESLITPELVAKIESLNLSTEQIFEAEMDGKEGVVVENDIFLTPLKIDQLIEETTSSQNEGNGQLKHYASGSSLPRNRNTTVNVFFDPALGDVLQAAFTDALQRYNELDLVLNFNSVTNEASADIAILSEFIPPLPDGRLVLGRSAGFPVNQSPASPIILNSTVYNPSSAPADSASVIAHEIGHAIGFRHTDWFDRSFSCGGSSDREPILDGIRYIPGTPRGPENGSWMLACSDGNDRPFTSGDIAALTFLY